MTTFHTPSVAVDAVIASLANFVELFLQGGKCVRGQTNRVSLPPTPCAVLTETLIVGLSTPRLEFVPDAARLDMIAPRRIDVQIDLYGAASGDHAQAMHAAFVSGWAYDQFPATVRPLYASDPMQVPAVMGEQQYVQRWTVTASLQYNPVVSVPQASATALAAATIPADSL